MTINYADPWYNWRTATKQIDVLLQHYTSGKNGYTRKCKLLAHFCLQPVLFVILYTVLNVTTILYPIQYKYHYLRSLSSHCQSKHNALPIHKNVWRHNVCTKLSLLVRNNTLIVYCCQFFQCRETRNLLQISSASSNHSLSSSDININFVSQSRGRILILKGFYRKMIGIRPNKTYEM